MLALIAGRGALPAAIAQAQSTPPVICALMGHDPDGLAVDVTFRIETLGTFLADLAQRGVHDVCFCGAVERPEIDPALIDPLTAPMVPTLAQAVAGGEDSALRAIVGLFEQAGLRVRGAHDLAPDLLPARGVLTSGPLPEAVDDAVALAAQVLADQGARDQGQACIIRSGTVLAREDARGTDAMLGDVIDETPPCATPEWGGGDPLGFAFDLAGDALASVADWLSGPVVETRKSAQGGILFKAPKPGQDRRVDLPTIGPATAMRAAEAGLDGIVIAAGGVIVLDQPQVTRILDGLGMFLWVR